MTCVVTCGGVPSTRPELPDPLAEEHAAALRTRLAGASGREAVSLRIELARVLLNQHSSDAALEVLRPALSVDPDDPRVYLLMALAHRERPQPRLAAARVLLEDAVIRFPRHSEIRLNLAQVYLQSQLTTAAEQAFIETLALAKDPSTVVSAQLGLVAIYERTGQEEKARAHLSAAREVFPGVDEIVRRAEIVKATPPPAIGDNIPEGTGIHPPLRERILRARDEIERMMREEQRD